MTRVLELANLVMRHPTSRGLLRAVEGVDLHVDAGETLGLVGESGCGKSTLARCVVGLNKPTSGRVLLGGAELSDRERAARARIVQMVFQDPMSSLNPRLTIRRIVEQPLQLHGMGDRAGRPARVEALMKQVGLAAYHLDRYPHELSGGQRQRVSIARALALEPKLIVCDEPVSALDVSVQAQVLNLLIDLQQRTGVGLLFISHDLAVIRYVSRRVAVMYLGKIVEIGDTSSVWKHRRHPYTRALIASIPDEASGDDAAAHMAGDPPSPINPPSGCAFRTRCPIARPVCAAEEPRLSADGRPHAVACHFADDIAGVERRVA